MKIGAKSRLGRQAVIGDGEGSQVYLNCERFLPFLVLPRYPRFLVLSLLGHQIDLGGDLVGAGEPEVGKQALRDNHTAPIKATIKQASDHRASTCGTSGVLCSISVMASYSWSKSCRRMFDSGDRSGKIAIRVPFLLFLLGSHQITHDFIEHKDFDPRVFALRQRIGVRGASAQTGRHRRCGTRVGSMPFSSVRY